MRTGDKSKLSRRLFIKRAGATAAAASAVSLFNINHTWSQDVSYDGGVFDAGGATLNLGEWGGFWEEFMRKNLIDQFEKDFNCKFAYDSSWPWFAKYTAGGPQKPVFDISNWNLPELFKTARAGDYFLSPDEIKPNVPNAANAWDFAFLSGVGVTWGFGQYVYAYRTDMVESAPTDFKSFWDAQFDGGKRGTYITSNTLQMVFFLTSSHVWGGNTENLEAGFDAMRRAMPMKISDFTGNMQTLIERGEVAIGVQWEGEVYNQMDKGIKIAPYIWREKEPVLTQTHTVSRYSEPMQKKLAFAYLHRKLDPAFSSVAGSTFYLRPTTRNATLPDNLASKGVTNSADGMSKLWIPDWNWYLEHEDEIVETVNEIFAG
ncbi:MAG: twin-arginine translocation signal domain-containing protein [Alphaproteobacteria bacterium]|nr:twin-arginine translocation signal domain-containing protein [Alphaproteobacteria bacterium]